MLRRVIPLLAVGISFSGCASDSPVSSSLTPVSVLSAQYRGESPPAQAAVSPEELPKKTLSDKVFTAIALERVTGLKPDPGQLAR